MVRGKKLKLMTKLDYSPQYYQTISPGSLDSAREVIPVITKFIQPQSVIDIGCGTGTWLSVWEEKAGIKDYLGVDGHYVNKEKLKIPVGKFEATDLERPFATGRKYDLVTSLEVAEHIRPQHASIFVSTLCSLGDVVLFSAAIPGQGGVLHYNEQYPPYWIELFSANGFDCYDCLRSLIWMNRKIDTCYRQNILFFVRSSEKEKYASITKFTGPVLSLVHPEHFEKKDAILLSYKKIVSTPFHAGWYFLKKVFKLFRTNTGNG